MSENSLSFNLIPSTPYLLGKILCRLSGAKVRSPKNDVGCGVYLSKSKSYTTIATMVVRSYRDNCEKPCCSGSHKQCKTLLKDHVVVLKIMLLYIYKDLRLILQPLTEITETNAKNGVVPLATSNVKLFLMTIW